jgi:rRNA processing protein Gar1
MKEENMKPVNNGHKIISPNELLSQFTDEELRDELYVRERNLQKTEFFKNFEKKFLDYKAEFDGDVY